MKHVGYGLIILLALALQTTSPGLVFFGLRPDLLLLLTLFSAMLQEPGGAAVFGFVSGLLQDILVGQFIGLYAGTYLLMAILVGFLAKRLYKENLLVRFFAIVLGTILGQILYLLGAASFGFSSPESWSLVFGILGTGLFNGTIGVLFYRPFVSINQRLIYLDELLKRTG
ncbi:MAG: rod shape-determining protein MreD [Limnochordia bacterium]|jgi:rod shape-determining protein MreD|nr:rod shape-determining protein MreD [Limnochordia bacterium]